MNINKLKFMSIVFCCFVLALCSEIKCMDEKTDKESYSHWGLSHWVSGIGEYFQRCCCCNYDDSRLEGAYGVWDDGKYISTSDCWCVSIDGARPGTGSSCDNPVIGTLCFPFVALAHLSCLPFALCCPSENRLTIYKSHEVTPVYTPPPVTGKRESYMTDGDKIRAGMIPHRPPVGGDDWY